MTSVILEMEMSRVTVLMLMTRMTQIVVNPRDCSRRSYDKCSTLGVLKSDQLCSHSGRKDWLRIGRRSNRQWLRLRRRTAR